MTLRSVDIFNGLLDLNHIVEFVDKLTYTLLSITGIFLHCI
jgi:hypothetical protein